MTILIINKMDDVNEDIIRHWLILKRLYEDILDGLYLKN